MEPWIKQTTYPIGKERVPGGRWVWSYPTSVGEHPGVPNTPEVQEVQEVRPAASLLTEA